jgi:hypothetical protein
MSSSDAAMLGMGISVLSPAGETLRMRLSPKSSLAAIHRFPSAPPVIA